MTCGPRHARRRSSPRPVKKDRLSTTHRASPSSPEPPAGSARRWSPPTASWATPSWRPRGRSRTRTTDVLAVAADIALPGSGAKIVDAALERFGRVDTLINNAGIFVAKPFTEYTDEDYDAVTGVNLRGFFEVSRSAVAAMLDQGGGHLVNVSTSLVDHANSSGAVRAGVVDQGRAQRRHQGAGDRIRRPRHPGQRRRPWDHPHAHAPTGNARRPRDACIRWAGWATSTTSWTPIMLSGERPVRHRRDPARRRRPERRTLNHCRICSTDGRRPSTLRDPTKWQSCSPTMPSSKACGPIALAAKVFPLTIQPSPLA